MKRVLVTGNLGYIGSVLAPLLRKKGYAVRGLDTGYYADCLLAAPDDPADQILRDIRQVTAIDLEGCEAVIHLAALSNDPLGELVPGLTEEINLHGTLLLAKRAREAGVRRFVYASSQSMYGISDTDGELDEDDSEKHPLTSYARTKWDAECALKKLADGDFEVVCFRPSTVFGASPRIRSDIIYNNLVGCAFSTGRIEIKSDGTPWRPVVHIQDVCAAFLAGLEAPAALVNGRSFNVGIPDGNFSVRQLAEAAQRCVPGSKLTFTGEHGKDSRTYRVGFRRILTELKDYFRPEWDLMRGGIEMVEFFRACGFTEADFRGPRCVRLARLKELSEQGRLDATLHWKVE